MFILFLSCEKEKTLGDYNENEFIEIQGIVVESIEITHFLGKSTWDIGYVFKHNNQSFMGKSKDFNIPMPMGQVVIVLVNKENPEINFFKEIGVLTK